MKLMMAAVFCLATAVLHAQELTLHVTSYKYEDLTPTMHHCADQRCTTGIFTVEASVENPNPNLITVFVIQCKSWMLLSTPPTSGKCWALKVGNNYAAFQGAGTMLMLLLGDTNETDPVYHVIEAVEKSKYHYGK